MTERSSSDALKREQIEQWLEGARDPQGHPGWHPQTNGEIAALCELALRAAPPTTNTPQPETAALQHDLSRAIANHAADLSQPAPQASEAALQRLCDLKRMKVALEEQVGDDLNLSGGVVKRADIQRYYDQNKDPAWQEAFAALRANEGSSKVPEGWKLVPVEPTQEWMDTFANALKASDSWAREIHEAVLAAAPSPTADE